MEHLFLNGEHVAPVSIPYIGSYFDHGDFFTFPERQGWDVSSWEFFDPETHLFNLNNGRIPDMASFLQSWLFFGLLNVFLGAECRPNDFIRTDEAGNKFITTKMLDFYLAKWSRKVKGSMMTGNERLKQSNLLESYLLTARRVNNTLNSVPFHEESPSDSDPLRQTLFAQMLLSEALYGAIVEVLEIQLYRENLFHDTYLRDRLLQSGWCITTVEYMQSKLPLQVQAYALITGSTRTRLGHAQCSQSDPAGCKRSQMGPDFKQQHISPDCRCAQVAVPVPELVEILRQNKVPVVTVKRLDNSLFPIELLLNGLDLDHEQCHTYFAFSHVWSDGLGNADNNALYQCQLERLDGMLQSLEGNQGFDTTARDGGTVAFWLDTLCIPVQKEYKAFRQTAIQNMHRIYSKAAGTVVVDPDIQTLSAAAKPVQVLSRVLCSSWRSRMWTYEEASLASHVYLPVDGSCFRFQTEHKLFEPPSGPPESLVERQLLRVCWERYRDLVWDWLASYSIAENPARAFLRMITAASNRNTTRKGDETICLATFLGLDTSQLVQTPVADRMPFLLSMLPAIPPEILFASGPRIERKGYRWAPESFLSPFGFSGDLRLVMPRAYKPVGLPFSGKLPVPRSFIHSQHLGLAVFLSGLRFQRQSAVTAPPLFSIETPSHGSYTVASEVPWMLSEPSSETETFAILLPDLRHCSVGLLVKMTGDTTDGKVLCERGGVVEITSEEKAEGLWNSVAENACFQGVHVPFQWWVVD